YKCSLASGVRRRGRDDSENKRLLWPESQRDLMQASEAPQHQPGAAKQHNRYGDLADDQHVLRAESRRSAGLTLSSGLQSLFRMAPRCLPGRQQPEQNPAQEGYGHGKSKDLEIDPNASQAWRAGGSKRN